MVPFLWYSRVYLDEIRRLDGCLEFICTGVRRPDIAAFYMPKQTAAQILGREGERWVQSILPPEWVFTRPSEDFGIDGMVAIGDRETMSPVEFAVQVKASSHWSVQADYIVVPGIPIGTLRYWAGRLMPTLLILYAPGAGKGHFAWTADLVSRADLEGASGRTVSLKVPQSNSLNADCWPAIRCQAIAYHQKLASALSMLSDAKPILRTVRALAQSLSLLVLPNHAVVGSANDMTMLRQISEVVAHREVVLSLRGLAAALGQGHLLQASLRDAAETYRSICSDFLHPFDDILAGSGRDVAVWANDERMSKALPQLISIVTGLLVGPSMLAIPEFSERK